MACISSLDLLPVSNASPPAQPEGRNACNERHLQTPQVTRPAIETLMFRG
jgi:hypothetical protein